MATKIPKATKDLARAKLRDGLTSQEVADLTGMSVRSVSRMKSLLDGTTVMPVPRARAGQSVPPLGQPEPPLGQPEDKTTLDFVESPAPVEKKNVVDSALANLKAMLGISNDPQQPKKAANGAPAAKLNARQQQFVDAATPTLSLGFIVLAAGWWNRIGPEYAILAPDELTAQRIIEPIVRIYARHSSFLMDINPDYADAGASLLALVGYAHVSLKLYQEIKREEYSDDEYEAETRSARRAYRTTAANAARAESRAGDQGRGYAPVSGANGIDAGVSSSTNGRAPGFDRPDLSDKEARQYAALSRLSDLDYEHRARRSGRN